MERQGECVSRWRMWAGGERKRMCEQVEDVGGWRDKENV